jgi:preprotein translocase subunit SecG
MSTVILVIHIMLAIALVATILLQRSEGGALGIGGGGMSGFMTGRATANLLSRTTAIIAAGFFATSLLLAYLGGTNLKPTSILEETLPGAPAPATSQPAVPVPESAPAPKTEGAAPSEKPATPDVPLAK